MARSSVVVAVLSDVQLTESPLLTEPQNPRLGDPPLLLAANVICRQLLAVGIILGSSVVSLVVLCQFDSALLLIVPTPLNSICVCIL